jgi:hypothetical protein
MQRTSFAILAGSALAVLSSSLLVLESPGELVSDFVETQRSRELDRALERTLYAHEERFRIVTQLEAGTISLDEAIELVRPLNENEPICLAVLRGRHPGHSDEALIGYQLLVAAYRQRRDCEEDRKRFLRRLCLQLEERFGSDMVPLPPLLSAD